MQDCQMKIAVKSQTVQKRPNRSFKGQKEIQALFLVFLFLCHKNNVARIFSRNGEVLLGLVLL